MKGRLRLLRWAPAFSTLLLGGCLVWGGKPEVKNPPVSETPAQQELSAILATDPPSPPHSPSPYPIVPAPPLRPAESSFVQPATLKVEPATTQPEDKPPPKVAVAEKTEPPAPDSPVVAALKCALLNDPRKAKQLLECHDAPTRERLLALLSLAADIEAGNLERLPPEDLADMLEQLRGLVESLRRRAPLILDKVSLCRRIDGFGRYETLPPEYAFQAGVEGRPGERIQVYAEVRNFTCQPCEGCFETVLRSSLEILDEKGQHVVTLNPPERTDRRSTPRQDYFLNFEFHVPAKLPPGSYTLRVTVKDGTRTAGQPVLARSARRSLSFKVRAPDVGSGAQNP
jgi:hypothetical protein